MIALSPQKQYGKKNMMNRDMTYCTNKECPLRSTCRRSKEPLDKGEYWYSYFQINESKECDHYMPKSKSEHTR